MSTPARRPRVLRVITRVNVGGPATHVVLANRGLEAMGWDTLLVHGDVDAGEAEIDLDAVEIARRRVPSLIRPIRPWTDAVAMAQLVRIIRSYRPDVIHTHLSKAGLVGRAAAIASSRAVRVHTFHGTVFANYFGASTSSMIVRAERLLGRRTHGVIALSDRQRDELLEFRIAPADRIRIVPLGLDLARFGRIERAEARQALGVPPEQVAIVAIGRLVPIKRLDRLVRAFAAVSQRADGVHLYLVGGGPEREPLETMVASLGLTDAVTFAGWSKETPAWYAAADVVALSSDREGTPLALIEAAAASRPVVAMDVGGVADVVADGQTGLVVARDDEAGLADALARLACDPALRERMGAAAPVHAEQFSYQRLVRDLDELYRSLLEGRRQ